MVETRKSILFRALALALVLTGTAGCGQAAQPPQPGEAATAATAAPRVEATTQAAPSPVATALPTAVPQIQKAPGTLVVEEHEVVSSDVDSPTRIEYRKRIDPMVLEKRKQWREVPLEARMEGINQVLAPFGYRLAKSERPGCPTCVSYRLLKGNETVEEDISHFWAPTLNEEGDDFLMLVEGRGKNLLVRRAGAEPWQPTEHAFMPPVFLGNEVLTVWSPGHDRYEVRKGDSVIHAAKSPEFIVDNPFKGFWSWQGHWVLELAGQVLVDGKSLNAEKGYDEVFGWRLLKGEPFYFFEKNGAVGMSYAGQELAQRYDEVIHYRCCEPAVFNVGGNDSMVWFHALRDGRWHYVEAGRFD